MAESVFESLLECASAAMFKADRPYDSPSRSLPDDVMLDGESRAGAGELVVGRNPAMPFQFCTLDKTSLFICRRRFGSFRRY